MLILVVEDNAGWQAVIREGLHAAGHDTIDAGTLAEARSQLATRRPDLLVVDRTLPDGDGLDLVSDLRNRGVPIPAIVVSALADVDDRIIGLRGGADDYVTKPFAVPELLARIDAVSRRSGAAESIRFGPLCVDIAQHQATLHGVAIELSKREFELLSVFVRHPGRGLTRAFLWEQAWGLEQDPYTNVVDVYVRHLRQKVGMAWIQTVRGVGYAFHPQLEPADERTSG